MTKKKKTLRAKVLASIFAMLICGCSNTVWAEIYNIPIEGTSNGDKVTTYAIQNYTDTDKQYGGTSSFAYNPTLTSPNGAAGNNSTVHKDSEFGTGKYSPEYNYFLQSYAYGANSNKIAAEILVERIIGVKMNESTTNTTELRKYGIEESVNVKGVQFFHVEYEPDGDLISPDGISAALTDTGISLKNDVGKDATGTSHYCGESAKSISIGQIQRALEVFYANDNSITQGLLNEARERFVTDVEHNNRLTTIEDAYVKDITIDGDVIKFTEVIDGEEQGEISYTDKHITDFTQSIIGYGQENAGTITSTIKTNFGDDIERTVNISGYVSYAIENEAGDAKYYKIGKDADGNLTKEETSLTINQAITQAKTTVSDDDKNIVVTSSINEDDGSTDYKVAIKDDVTFNSVTTATLDVTDIADINIANIGTAEIRSLLAENAQINEAKINSLEAITANIQTTNTEVVNLGTKDGGTDIKWNDSEGRITYNDGTEQIANLNDGLYYTGDVTTDNKQGTYAKLNKKVKIYGGATAFTEDDNIGVETTQDGDNVKMKVRLAKDQLCLLPILLSF